MGLYAFRAMILLSVHAGTPAVARSLAAGVTDVLSRIRYGKGVISVRMDAPSPEVALDPLGDGFTCRLCGHVSVEADAEQSAHDLAFRWRRLIQENLGRHSRLSFPRFDLHPL